MNPPDAATAKSVIRVLIADDHALFREGIRSLLATQQDMEVVAEVEDGREAVRLALGLRPDVVLMDITMPRLDGIEATRRICSHNAAIKVLVLTMHDNEDVFFRALSAGASGYVLKRSASVELMSAIRAIKEGHSYLSPFLARALMRDYVRRAGRDVEHAAEHGAGRHTPARLLSTREQEVLKLIAEGHSSREIAEMLDLSVKTVHNHRTRLMAKLDLHRNADLVRYAIRNELIHA